ncbi:MAG: hypothetical protein AAF559_09350 [Pseudomonadota bacterium]
MESELRKLEALLVSIIAAAILFMIMLSHEDLFNAIGLWLYNWQTLVSGILATIAAAITIRILWLQLKQSDRREERQMVREHQAKRFLLVFTLSSVISYSVDAMKALSLALANSAPSGSLDSWSAPVFPIETIRSLSEFLETSENEVVNARIAFLITQLQMLDARLRSMTEYEGDRVIALHENLAVYLLQAAKVYQVTGSLFIFARGEVDELDAKLSREQLASHLQFNDYGEGNEAFERWLDRWMSRGEYWRPQSND